MKKNIAVALLLFLVTLCSCKKFLNEDPDTSLYIPRALEDYNKLLEDEKEFSQTHGLALISADQFYFHDFFFDKISDVERNAHTWQQIVFTGKDMIEDWSRAYTQIGITNHILNGLRNIAVTTSNKDMYNKVKGDALFFQAYTYYNLAQVFVLAYDISNAGLKLGIPIRKTAEINEPTTRSTIGETYSHITANLKWALQLLPWDVDPAHPNRASQAACYALLARTYMSMRKYDSAGIYADSCLQIHNALIDFNTIDITDSTPFTASNKEVLYQSKAFLKSSMVAGLDGFGWYIDTTLYRSYANNDLRRSIYFSVTANGNAISKGSYNGSPIPFTGLATDEVLLIRAECYARADKTIEAMTDLNALLVKRWRSDHFMPRTASNSSEALRIILDERYKELVLRGQRWTDIRRLNKEFSSIPLSRFLNGQQFNITPNDNRFVLPIPEIVIQQTGIEQNPR